jgi:hypothetical protein
MDTDYFVPIKIESTLMVRGAERTYETSLGDYKEVNGWYLPFSYARNAKGSQNSQTFAYDKIVANEPIDDMRFTRPKAPAGPPTAPDASEKKPEEAKPATPASPSGSQQEKR